MYTINSQHNGCVKSLVCAKPHVHIYNESEDDSCWEWLAP